MKKYKLIIILLTFPALLFSQATISNVSFKQQGKTAVISFTVSDKPSENTIFYISTNGGTTFKQVGETDQKLQPGSHTWDYSLQNSPLLISDRVVFKVESKKMPTSGTFTDPRDGETYKWVKIGKQVWMAENLRYASGKYVNNNSDWAVLGDNNTDAAYCWYNNDNSYKPTYGALYTYAAALNACPSGWHLPSDDEWTELENYLIANGYNYDGSTSGDKTAKSLATKIGWDSSETGDVGNNPGNNNKTGFSVLAGGCRYSNFGNFGGMGGGANFWSSTASSSSTAWRRYLRYDNESLGRYYGSKSFGFSVRCVRD